MPTPPKRETWDSIDWIHPQRLSDLKFLLEQRRQKGIRNFLSRACANMMLRRASIPALAQLITEIERLKSIRQP